jgi:predicted MFS family arabinose efflux permease
MSDGLPVTSRSLPAGPSASLERQGRAPAALTALSLAAFAFVTTESLPIGLLPELSGALGRSTAAIGFLVTAYALVVVVATLPLTRLSRGIPRKPLLAVLLAVMTLTTLASALAPGYAALLAARIVGAASQALFWALVVPTAAGLVGPRQRGRALSLVFAGGSLAVIVGVPAGTWIGQALGWRWAFGALAAVGLVSMLALTAWLPSGPRPSGRQSAAHPGWTGRRQDPGPYRRLVVVTALASTGAFAGYTYITTFLDDVTHLDPSAAGPTLLVRGLAGLAGVAIGGFVTDRGPARAVVAFTALQAAALAGLVRFGGGPVGSVALWSLAGLAFAALGTALAARLLDVAPGDPDVASAGISTAVNVGITLGALTGGLLLGLAGPLAAVTAGAAFSVAGLMFCAPTRKVDR